MKSSPWPSPLSAPSYRICDDTIRSDRYEDIYFSRSGGLQEKNFVFVEANAIRARMQRSIKFTVLELGFGLGLNLLATMDAHSESAPDCILDYVAFEKHPFNKRELKKCLDFAVPGHNYANSLIENLPPLVAGFHRIHIQPRVVLTLIFGDAENYLKEVDAEVDAFYLDGFSPKKNPSLWSPRIFKSFRRLASHQATFSTYTSAGEISRAMNHAGFVVNKKSGFRQKREMLCGQFKETREEGQRRLPKVYIVGGGVAGCSLAYRLAAYGLQSSIIDRESELMKKASSNPIPLIRPTLSLDFGPRGQLGWGSFLYAIKFYDELTRKFETGWRKTGVIQMARDSDDWSRMLRAARLLDFNEEIIRQLSDYEIKKLGTANRNRCGVFFPSAGYLEAPGINMAKGLSIDKVNVILNAHLEQIDTFKNKVSYSVNRKRTILSDGLYVLCNGVDIQRMGVGASFKQTLVRGQSTAFSSFKELTSIPICRSGYTGAIGNQRWVSGSFDVNNSSLKSTVEDERSNALRLNMILGSASDKPDLTVTDNWVGIRSVSHDRLPIAGQLSKSIYALGGLGSRGFTWGPLMGEILASKILQLSSPIGRSIQQRLSPLRFAGVNGN